METYEFKKTEKHVIKLLPTMHPNIFAWKVNTTSYIAKSQADIIDDWNKTERQGLVFNDDINKLKTGNFDVSTQKSPEKGGWVLLPQAALSEIAMWGYSGKDGSFAPWSKVSKKPFDDIMHKNNKILVRDCQYDYTIFDTNDEHLVVGMYCSCIDGYDSNKFNIERAHKILSQRKDVHSLSSSGGYIKTISFFWSPDVDTYRKMMRKVVNRSLDEHKVIFDLDLLGLRAGGAALYDNFYNSKNDER